MFYRREGTPHNYLDVKSQKVISGTSFIGRAINAVISIWNEDFLPSSLEMLIPSLTASPIKDVPDLQLISLSISHTHLHVVLFLM